MKIKTQCKLQEKINNGQSILGLEVIGVDGCRSPYKGIVKKVTVWNHTVLGLLVQIWINWEDQGEHLTPYFPRQFKPYSQNCGPGVYLEQ